MRRIILIVTLFFVTGIIFHFAYNVYFFGAGISALFLIAFWRKQKALALFCMVFLLLGFITASLHQREFQNRYNLISKSKKLEGYVIEKYDNNYIVKNYKTGYKLSLTSYNEQKINPGDYIVFSGEVREKPAFKENFMNSNGIDSYINLKSLESDETTHFGILMLPVLIKYKITSAFLNIDNAGGGFISGLVSGYTDDMQYKDTQNFNELGISHILAISGFNLGIIYLFISIATRKLGARLRYSITICTCFFYTLLGGVEPSILRAFIMICIVMLGKILNKPYDIINGITLSAFVMLLINSYYIFNTGFILSFAATYGIVLFKDDIKDKIPDILKKLRNELSIAFSAFIATFPIILWNTGYVSAITIAVNLIVAPFIVFVTVLGFAGSALYIVFGIKILLYPVVLMGIIFLKLINYISQFNLIIMPGRPSFAFIIIYYILMGLIFKYIKIKFIEKYGYAVKILLTAALIILLFYKSNYLKIHFLNVGQGDSIFIETPHRKSILIDTGPEYEAYSALRDKVLPYLKRDGYNKIDALIITHFHNDHAGGIDYLLQNFEVDNMFTYESPEKYSKYFTKVSVGNHIVIDNVDIEILAPQENTITDGDENETCLVMGLKFNDFSTLLTSDADQSVIDPLAGNYDIYKVPHHGSIYSLSEKMLDNSRIGTAIISVGKNSFGHPSPIVINELEKNDVNVLRTDKKGDITVVTQGKKYKILFE